MCPAQCRSQLTRFPGGPDRGCGVQLSEVVHYRLQGSVLLGKGMHQIQGLARLACQPKLTGEAEQKRAVVSIRHARA